MKTALHFNQPANHRKRGLFEVDLAVAVVILALAIIPLGFSFGREREMLRIDYVTAVANEVVDGEMEILMAGDWKNFQDGTQVYPVHSHAAENLPAGRFELTKTDNHLRLEWTPDAHNGVGAVIREISIK